MAMLDDERNITNESNSRVNRSPGFFDSNSPIQDDVLLPAQFFDRVKWETPEKRLIAAVLETALMDYHAHRLNPNELRGKQYNLWYSAYRWLINAESDSIFSLRWCCEALGEIDITKLVDKIRAREPIGSLRAKPVIRASLLRLPPKRSH